MQLKESDWFKAQKSNDQGLCVEVNFGDGNGVAVRHSKIRGATIEYSNAEWDAFIDGAKRGEFDRKTA